MDMTYSNKLKQIIGGDFAGTEGFKSALNTGLTAVNRSNSRMRGSGNALAALTKYGTELAMKDRGDEISRLTALDAGEKSYDLGDRSAKLGTDRLAFDTRMGDGSLALGRDRLALDDRMGAGRLALDADLGHGALDNTRDATTKNFLSTMYRADNDYDVAKEGNANNAQRNWWDHSDTRDRLNLDTVTAENQHALEAERAKQAWFNARTARGSARANDYWTGYKATRGGY